MKILNIILESRLGGPQLRILAVAEYLARNSNALTMVIAPIRDSQEMMQEMVNRRIEFHLLRLHKLSKNPIQVILWGLYLIPEIIQLVRVINKYSPDVIHCNGSWQLKGVIAGILSGRRIVWHLNDTKIPFPLKASFNFLSRWVNGLIFAGKKVKCYYSDALTKNRIIATIHAPIDLSRFDPDTVTVNSILTKLKGLKVVTVGNINPLKGIDIFIKTAHIVGRVYPQVQFIIVGHLFSSQKTYIKYLKEMIAKCGLKNITFLGGISDIPGILKGADIFVCSSISEASPMAVWEAMAMGVPIVSTDVGSVSEVITDGRNGFIVEPGRPDRLAEKVVCLLADSRLRKKLCADSRRLASQHFDLKIIAQKHLQIYTSIINSCKGKM